MSARRSAWGVCAARRASTAVPAPAAGVAAEPWRRNLQGFDDARLKGKRDEKWWYTGTKPQETPGFDGKSLRFLPQPRLDQVTKHMALAFFQNTWTFYELLFASLQGEEAFFRPPQHGLRHPMQFYYGHTAVFYINKSVVAGLLDKPIEPLFEAQFEVGVDEMRWDDMTLGDNIWPRVSEVLEYRREVYRTMVDLIERNLDSSPKKVTWDDPLWSLFMACEHDRIHAETSSVLIRELPLELLRRPKYFPGNFQSEKGSESHFPKNELITVKGQEVVLGKKKEYPSYGWDNEYGHLKRQVNDFQASKDLVTNGEFLEFVKAGGYRDRKFWSEEGWGWRRFRNAQHPFFWVRNGPAGSHKYLLRHIFEVSDFSLSLPVVVNYHEAKAFCNWKAERDNLKGLRLPTECEHQLLLDEHRRNAKATPSTDPAMFVSGELFDSKYSTNSSFAYSSERPVDAHPPNSQGFRDSMGNVWQWCEDQMAPLPGFETHPYYGDFTEPCFDGKHHIIKGGSFASTSDNGANAHCRYHFRPHFLQHSGIRYVLPSISESFDGEAGGVVLLKPTKQQRETVEAPRQQQTQGDYETTKMVSQYLALHFDANDDAIIPHANRPEHALNFPRRCAQLLAESYKECSTVMNGSKRVALDIGCAVGGSTFQLATLGFDDVLGVDMSKAFIKTAEDMRASTKLPFKLEENSQEKPLVASLSTSEIERRLCTRFQVGDACALPPTNELGGPFDAILAANLLCRLPDPYRLLQRMPDLVKPGGVVLFVSPFSWMTSFTESSKWLGDIGNSEKELEMEMRSLGFTLVKEQDMPLIMRDHRRKYQYIVSHGAAFRNDNP